MASNNYGVKISKRGVEVTDSLTELNKRFFQLISTDGCLLKKEEASSPSTTNRFLGYKLTDSDTKAHPLNYHSGTARYIIYENEL